MSFGFNQSEQSVTDERSVRNGNKLFENSVGNKSLFGLIQAGYPLVQLLHPSDVLEISFFTFCLRWWLNLPFPPLTIKRKETEELHWQQSSQCFLVFWECCQAPGNQKSEFSVISAKRQQLLPGSQFGSHFSEITAVQPLYQLLTAQGHSKERQHKNTPLWPRWLLILHKRCKNQKRWFVFQPYPDTDYVSLTTAACLSLGQILILSIQEQLGKTSAKRESEWVVLLESNTHLRSTCTLQHRLSEPLLWCTTAGSHPEKHRDVLHLFQSQHWSFSGVARGFFQPSNLHPRPPLQLVVWKSSGVKKQEAMQRRERIQIEAWNCSSNSSPGTHPTSSSLPTPLPQATFFVRNTVLLLLTGNWLRSCMAREPLQEGKSSSVKEVFLTWLCRSGGKEMGAWLISRQAE